MFAKLVVILVYLVYCLWLPTTTENKEFQNTEDGWDALIEGHNSSSFMKIYTYGNKKYFINSGFKASYFEATLFCEQIHMKLLDIQNHEENSQIYKYVSHDNGRYWTSGANFLDGINWIWMTNLQDVTYTNWGEHEPNQDPEERCIEVIHMDNFGVDGLYWNDRPCAQKGYFICEREYKGNSNSEDDKNKGTIENFLNTSYISANIPVLHFEDKIYFVGKFYRATFLEALQLCKMMDMNLIKIDSAEENDIIHLYLLDYSSGSQKFWSSGTRLLDGKTWIWLGDAQPIEYTNWAPIEENTTNVNYNCIQLSNINNDDLYWNSKSCDERNFYICEKPKYS